MKIINAVSIFCLGLSINTFCLSEERDSNNDFLSKANLSNPNVNELFDDLLDKEKQICQKQNYATLQ